MGIKSTTIQKLLQADIAESAARYKRYYQSSSMHWLDKFHYRQKMKSSPRDRVMKRLLQINMKKAMKDIEL